MGDVIPPHALKAALKQYRKDVPSVGTVTFEESQALLEKGFICRGWTETGEGKRYFHIIRCPQNYPEKTFMMARTEKELFTMTVYRGMDAAIDLDLLVAKDVE